MKTLTVLHIHSTVDLITNSSSEVFIGDTNKTIETIKTAIEKIVGAVDGESSGLWTSSLQEPELSQWTINAPRKSYNYNKRDPQELESYKMKSPKWPGQEATKKQKDEYNKNWQIYLDGLNKVEDKVYGADRKESEKEQVA